jgi:large subunit ribosomal protein L25
MASSAKNYIQLAKSLPEPLQRFFARWPPAAIVPEGTPKTLYQERRANPFEFFKNPATGKMQDPVYSNRRQAQLVKMAREHGVEHLLPESKKGTAYRLAYRVEHGLRVKGTGVGQSVKGHIHERHMIAKYVPAALSESLWKIIRLTARTGWKPGERLCWRCPSSSRPGRG